MPHKKNTIATEQIEGMARMAKKYAEMITENIVTWEERAIEQSSVERVAWPDLFHVTVRSLVVMTEVLEGLRVYPENMLLEIADSRGCYASDEAKEWLKGVAVPSGLMTEEECYRLVQMAAFNVFVPTPEALEVRENPPASLEEATELLGRARQVFVWPGCKSIQELIPEGGLLPVADLKATSDEVDRWNLALKQVFSIEGARQKWDAIFQPAHLLRHEAALYRQILGDE